MKCAVISCKSSNFRKNADSILPTFHKFPNDPVLRNAWLRELNRNANEFSVGHSGVCSHHFSPDCYIVNARTQTTSKRLKKNALPTLFLHQEETVWDMEHVQVCNLNSFFSYGIVNSKLDWLLRTDTIIKADFKSEVSLCINIYQRQQICIIESEN